MGLVTEYPLWFILFCILLGAAYAIALYYRAKSEVSRSMMILLAIFRFLSVFLISFLLLSPLIKKRVKTVEKPLIAIGLDNSRSVVLGKDSASYRKDFPEQMASFIRSLEKKFEVRTYVFGESVREGTEPGFTDKITNISSFFGEMEKRLAGRNVGAVIIASDGIYNQGLNPVYAVQRISWPIYAVSMGDTIRKRDILVRKVVFNRQAFLGDHFPAEIMVEAMKCRGETAVLKVMKGAKTLAEIPVNVNSDRYSRKFSVQIEATEKGLQHYTVTLSPVKNEYTQVNNRRDFFVEVVDEQQKVAILFDAPHPDIAAIREALESGIRFNVSVSELSKFSENPNDFDLIILYQLPSVSGVMETNRILKSSASLLYVLGTHSDLFSFNHLGTGLTITSQKSSYTESQPVINRSFPLFSVEKEMQDVMDDYPPLVCPFGTYQSSPLSDVFLFQKIGAVTSQFPMVIFFRNGDKKSGVITGENLWRWRLSDFVQKGDHHEFDELISKIAMYLSVKGDKSFFRVNVKNPIPENENVEFTADVRNQSYELINDPDVTLVIKDGNGKLFPFVMAKTGTDYYLNAGNFPAGEYSYEASVSVGKNKYVKKGAFMVEPINLEALNMVADYALLNQLTVSHDGYTTTPDGLPELAKKLLQRDDISSVSHFTKRYSDLTGTWWVFVLIIGLLAVEWTIRKRSGM